jgi:hypothetical protein
MAKSLLGRLSGKRQAKQKYRTSRNQQTQERASNGENGARHSFAELPNSWFLKKAMDIFAGN